MNNIMKIMETKNNDIELETPAKDPNDLTSYTVTELKAMVYDFNVTIEQMRNNIGLVNQELAKRNGAK